MRSISTRAHITTTTFVNTYNWGDLKARPIEMMEKYFDAFVYVANWGTREFMVRLPRKLVEMDDFSAYKAGNNLSFDVKGDHAIVTFLSDPEEGGGWESGEGYLSSLVPIRKDLLDGDIRSLYLGWLLGVQMRAVRDNTLEPPAPPGLADLSGSLKALADFLRIDNDLIAAAGESQVNSASGSRSRDDFPKWIRSLPDAEKDALLTRLANGEDRHMRAELLQRFRQSTSPQPTPVESKRRTVKELLAAAEQRTQIRRKEIAEREARERSRREKEEAAAREKRLDGLAKRQAEVWRKIDSLIEARLPKNYDEAVSLLNDLHDLAARSVEQGAFNRRLAGLRKRHSRKPTLLERIDRVGLGEQRAM